MLKRIVAWFRAVRLSFSPWCDACYLNSASIPHAADCVRAGALQIGLNGQITEFGINRPHTKIPPVIYAHSAQETSRRCAARFDCAGKGEGTMTKYVHIGTIHHDGSGTIITAIDLIACAKPLPCERCKERDGAIRVSIDAANGAIEPPPYRSSTP